MTSDIPFRRTQDILSDIEHERNPEAIRLLARELNEAFLCQERRRAAQKLWASTRDMEVYGVKPVHSGSRGIWDENT